jgi:hypothetical protein
MPIEEDELKSATSPEEILRDEERLPGEIRAIKPHDTH